MDLSPIGWITLIGAILLFLSLPIGQSRNQALFNLANTVTLIGTAGLLIGHASLLFS
ncbi:MAG: hypothetical protein IPG59_11675 [Candidatus Melainabacteria bacterium]|nr:MAG: hypothetical protein IPG59_11675 [Candidatus Melainabacteria bacterium]